MTSQTGTYLILKSWGLLSLPTLGGGQVSGIVIELLLWNLFLNFFSGLLTYSLSLRAEEPWSLGLDLTQNCYLTLAKSLLLPGSWISPL